MKSCMEGNYNFKLETKVQWELSRVYRKSKEMPKTQKAYHSREDLLSLLITLVIHVFAESRKKHLPELNKLISFPFIVLQYIIGKIQKLDLSGRLRTLELFIPCCDDHFCFALMKYTPV